MEEYAAECTEGNRDAAQLLKEEEGQQLGAEAQRPLEARSAINDEVAALVHSARGGWPLFAARRASGRSRG